MEMSKPRILVLASGSRDGGGSGLQEMVEYSRTNPPVLDADIVGVISNHAQGGISKKARALGITFCHWPGPYTAEWYRSVVSEFDAHYVMCSGWLKKVMGLDPSRTINIHPGPLPFTEGLYGHHVHEAMMAAYHRGEMKQSAVTMHFITEDYDRGPIFFRQPIFIRPDDTPETLASRVNEVERAVQSFMLNQVVHGRIVLEQGKVIYR